MSIPISGSTPTRVTLGGQKPIPTELAKEMVENGERLMITYKGLDGSTIDTNPEAGKVKFRTPGRFGNDVSAAEFSGDIYNGKLAINKDMRGEYLSREFEFNRENGDEVIITDHLGTFHKQEMNVYRIKNGYLGTVEHVVVD